MDEPLPIPVNSEAFNKDDKIQIAGWAMVFLLSVVCMTANFYLAMENKPGSVPSEPIWALATVLGVHKVSTDKYCV